MIPAPVPSSLKVSPEMSSFSGSIMMAKAPPASAMFLTCVTVEHFFVFITRMKLLEEFTIEEGKQPKGSDQL